MLLVPLPKLVAVWQASHLKKLLVFHRFNGGVAAALLFGSGLIVALPLGFYSSRVGLLQSTYFLVSL